MALEMFRKMHAHEYMMFSARSMFPAQSVPTFPTLPHLIQCPTLLVAAGFRQSSTTAAPPKTAAGSNSRPTATTRAWIFTPMPPKLWTSTSYRDPYVNASPPAPQGNSTVTTKAAKRPDLCAPTGCTGSPSTARK